MTIEEAKYILNECIFDIGRSLVKIAQCKFVDVTEKKYLELRSEYGEAMIKAYEAAENLVKVSRAKHDEEFLP
jgi:hypothetical protein